jgi:Phosphodiester glycosidase
MTVVRPVLLFLVLLAGIAPLCPAHAGSDLVLRQAALPGGATLHYMRVPLARYDLRVLAASVPLYDTARQAQKLNPERSASGYSLEDYLRRYRALAVLSGGYIDSYSPPTPLGLVRSNGFQLSSVHRSWLVDGFYCAKPGHAEISPVDMDPLRRGFVDCVQAGPLLLLNGRPPDSKGREEPASYQKFVSMRLERTFICLTGRREAIIGISDKIEFPKLVTALQQPQFDCVDAIGLTGGSSGGLRFGNRLVGKDEFLYPSVLGVMPAAH